jgi:4-amino-4-deoxy-L-arabinose transferase-like glycosyltransferase
MARKTEQLCLVLLVALLLAWDLWALVVDRQITIGPDSFLYHTLRVLGDLDRGGGATALFLEAPKGPVPAALALVLVQLVGQVPLATRLLSTLAHGVLVLQTHDLGRRLGESPRAGLWAALVCGTAPMVVGWSRMDYPELLLAAMLLATLQLLQRVTLDRMIPAVVLGVTLGLGILTKPGFVIYVIGPGLWFLYVRLRSRRALARAAVTLVAMAAVAGPWLLVNAGMIGQNIAGATHLHAGAWEKARSYLSLPGIWPLLLVFVAATVGLWRHRSATRPLLAPLALTVLIPLGLLLLVFDAWSRYLVPVIPTAAVVVGAGISELQGRFSRHRYPALIAAAGLVGTLLALFVWLNLSTPLPSPVRSQQAGMLSPNPRPLAGLERAISALGSHGRSVLLVFASPEVFGYTEGLVVPSEVWRLRGLELEPIDLTSARHLLAGGDPLPVLLVQEGREQVIDDLTTDRWRPDPETTVELAQEMRRRLSWFSRQTGRQRLLSAIDPGLERVRFSAYLVRAHVR